MTIQVTKRDGNREPLDIEKLHKVVWWATENITGVSASQVEISSNVQFYDGIASIDIQETLIKSAADLISEETPNYQFVAGRLNIYITLRKMVYGGFATPWHVYKLVKHNVEAGFLRCSELLSEYTLKTTGILLTVGSSMIVMNNLPMQPWNNFVAST